MSGRPKGDYKLNQELIVNELVKGPLSMKELADKTNLGRTTIYRLVKHLEGNGVVTKEKWGRKTICTLKPDSKGFYILLGIWEYSIKKSRVIGDKSVANVYKRRKNKIKMIEKTSDLLDLLKKSLEENTNEIAALEGSGSGFSTRWAEELRKIQKERYAVGLPTTSVKQLTPSQKDEYVTKKLEPYIKKFKSAVKNSDIPLSEKTRFLSKFES